MKSPFLLLLIVVVSGVATIAGATGLDGTSAAPAAPGPRPLIDTWGGVGLGGGLLGAAAVVLYALRTSQELRSRVASEIRAEIAAQERAERAGRVPSPLEVKEAHECASRREHDALAGEVRELKQLTQRVAGLESAITHISRGVENIEVLLMTKGGRS